MVNIIIYMQEESKAYELVHMLLLEGLIASGSVDKDNSSHIIVEGKVVKENHFVITAQTKALLFSHIERLIEDTYGRHVPLFSMPITQVNDSFDRFIRDTTRKI